MMDSTNAASLEVTGNLTVANNGTLYVNSKSSGAVTIHSTGKLTTGAVNVVGGVSNSGSMTGTINAGSVAQADPLASVPEPTPSGVNKGKVTVTGATTLSPGTYTNIDISAGAAVTMLPGIYTFAGSGAGMTVGKGATITGSGVMFYTQAGGDNFNFDDAGVINLTPPTTGIYQGISWFQPRSSTTEIHLRDGSDLTIGGTLYSAKGFFDLQPNGKAVFNMGSYIGTQLEAGNQYDAAAGRSTGTIILNAANGAPTQRLIQLVE